MEAFRVIFRVEKNVYLWCGLSSISETLSRLESGEELVPEKELLQGRFKSKSNKKKMLTSLSMKLIRLFMASSRTQTCMTLEEAARVFCGQYASASKIKTKVRRLYDISNVFLALNILEKTMVESRKPAYIWRGLEGFIQIQDKLKV